MAKKKSPKAVNLPSFAQRIEALVYSLEHNEIDQLEKVITRIEASVARRATKNTKATERKAKLEAKLVALKAKLDEL